MSDTATFSVPDVSCQHCVDAITAEVGAVEGVESVAVDLDAKVVTVVGGTAEGIVAAIEAFSSTYRIPETASA